jgi:hypothetical protein
VANFKIGDKLVAIKRQYNDSLDIIVGKHYKVVGLVSNSIYQNEPIVEGIDHVIPSQTMFGDATIDGISLHRQAIHRAEGWFRLSNNCKHSCCSDDEKVCPFREMIE